MSHSSSKVLRFSEARSPKPAPIVSHANRAYALTDRFGFDMSVACDILDIVRKNGGYANTAIWKELNQKLGHTPAQEVYEFMKARFAI